MNDHTEFLYGAENPSDYSMHLTTAPNACRRNKKSLGESFLQYILEDLYLFPGISHSLWLTRASKS